MPPLPFFLAMLLASFRIQEVLARTVIRQWRVICFLSLLWMVVALLNLYWMARVYRWVP
jgi:hypothetical protein